MLAGVVHLHFQEGERMPGEATLGFEKAMWLLEAHGIRQIVATFHLRHPSDLRLARPQLLLRLIEEYDGPIRISLMPEANLVLRGSSLPVTKRISHDIATWKRMSVRRSRLRSLVSGWILSAHFTRKLGWSKHKGVASASEQTFEFMIPLYCQIMRQEWRGWIGHPFQWCAGGNVEESVRRFVTAAANKGRIVEISVKPVRGRSNLTIQEIRESISMFRPDIIAEFSSYSMHTGDPLAAISVDAHSLTDLELGLENASRVAEWLVAEGVRPEQIWGWDV